MSTSARRRAIKKERLFAYGTLRDDDIKKLLFGGIVTGTPDRLPGYVRSTTDVAGVHYPNIVPAEGSEVPGELLEVDGEALRRADAYETDVYARRMMRLASGVSAWVYIRE